MIRASPNPCGAGESTGSRCPGRLRPAATACRRQGHTREVEQRREHVDMLGDVRHPLAALEETALRAAHPAVETGRLDLAQVRTVVAGKHHDRVPGEPQGVERGENATDVRVEILDHRILGRRLRFETLRRVRGEEILRRLHGGVAGIERHIAEEGAPRVLLNEGQRRIREHVSDEARSHRRARPLGLRWC